MKPTRILLCNHHPLIRNCLRLVVEREPAFRVVGEAANDREAMMLAAHTHPDILVIDINFPQINGIATARQLRAENKNVGIIFVTMHPDQEYVSEAFKAGARGYVLADSAQNDLIPAIWAISRGDGFLSPNITAELVAEYSRTQGPEHERLSDHEEQLLCLLAEGFEDQEIAQRLNTNLDDVRSGRERMKDKHLGMPELIRESILRPRAQ